MTRSARPGTTVVVLLGLLGGYLAFDAYDVVPGMLTTTAPWPEVAPFPEAPGAVEPPAPETVYAVPAQSAPVPDAAVMQQQVDALTGDKRLGSRVSAVVVDAITGDTLAAADESELMTPASAQKILTGVAALSSPLADRTLATTVVRDEDTVTLVGGGDIMLAPGQGDPAAINGRAGMADLADQVAADLRAAGKKKVRLAVDDTLFTGPRIAPAVSGGNRLYVGAASPIGVNVGLVSNTAYSIGPYVDDAARQAGDLLATRLEERGIKVTALGRGTAPEGAAKIAEVRSATVAEITEYFLHSSDNTLTEVVGRLVAIEAGAPGSVDGATQAVVSAVEAQGVDLTGAKLKDCSGLGDGSRLSARQLTSIVQLMLDPAHSELRVLAVDMPIGGLNGTLYARFRDESPARGVVRAKTGSLPRTRALAGTVMTTDQRQLVFVLLADAIPPNNAVGATWIFDDFVDELAAYSAG
ncbi:D-alanyl-D-alanine carboxypeptidase/D-alanyl-D-alanine-endopeptidase [Myceligenerans crystallogenes]|uniref:D-alanyl-D-alanine carboxypeptidase / D-alanyl-D-alanine-endopeptidase (Penicillin-binding protein 4) n=1 Tax=Myceligenerans crystallogenes TaxID=316335 RepID=A0ABN2N9R9_9MICO